MEVYIPLPIKSWVSCSLRNTKGISILNTLNLPLRPKKKKKKQKIRSINIIWTAGQFSPFCPLFFAYKQKHNFHIDRKSTVRELTFFQPRNVIFVIFKMLSCSDFYLFQLSFWHLSGNRIDDIKNSLRTQIYNMEPYI